MNPAHWIHCGEREHSRKHLVESNAHRVEIAASINRPVHATCLLGRHIGKRAAYKFGRSECLPLARQPRGNSKAGNTNDVGVIHEQVRRLDVLVDQTSKMNLSNGFGKTYGDPEKSCHFECGAEAAVQRIAAWISSIKVAFSLRRNNSRGLAAHSESSSPAMANSFSSRLRIVTFPGPYRGIRANTGREFRQSVTA